MISSNLFIKITFISILDLTGISRPGQSVRGNELLHHVLHLLPVLGRFPKHVDPHTAVALGEEQPGRKRTSDEAFLRGQADNHHYHHHHHHATDHRRCDSWSFSARQRLSPFSPSPTERSYENPRTRPNSADRKFRTRYV